jgi:hypothetical protein
MYKIIEENGTKTYKDFDYPESIDGLDKQIILNTLSIDEFIAEMSDDWSKTKSELKVIETYRKKHNLY